MASIESSEHLSPAGEAYAEFLARGEAGEEVDFDAFCAERPELEESLRRMHAGWATMNRAFDQLGSRGAGEAPSRTTTDSSASAVLERLSERGAAGERYTVRREIARGGMGAILDVWDPDLRRRLAMKVLLQRSGGRPDPRSLSRFLEEAQVTGQLEHPGIVPVHELGLDAEGCVYFTMPLVRGEDLEHVFEKVAAGELGWTVARALGVIVRVCEAVGFAHSRGVLHRDLKPSNVRVGIFGETYVMDWGLARVLEEEARADLDAVPEAALVSSELRTVRSDTPSSPLSTMAGDVVGTPAYMSPEQASGRIERVGPASDVYSIGAILYRLLTGWQPYLSPDESGSVEAVLAAVRTRPPRPIHELAPDVPPEVEAICLKAMARDPERRYRTTMELAADLRAFLEQRVVEAYEQGAWAELRMWIRRNHWLAAASAALLASLVAGITATTSFWLRARQSERMAIAQREIAEQRERLAVRERARADVSAQNLAAELRVNDVERGRLLLRDGALSNAEDLLWPRFLEDPSDLHAYWALWELHAEHPALRTWTAHPDAEMAWPGLGFAFDGALVTIGNDGYLRRWSPKGEDLLGEVRVAEPQVLYLALSSDRRLAGVVGLEDGVLRLVELPDLRPIASVEAHGGGARAVAFHSAGTRVATTGFDLYAREWSVPDLALLRETRLPDLSRALAYGSDGVLAIGTSGGAVHLWPEAEAAPLLAWSEEEARTLISLLFAEGGRMLVSGGNDRQIRSWSLDGGPPVRIGSRKNGSIRDLLLLADGRTLVSAGWYRVDFWDLEGGRLLHSFPQGGQTTAVDQSPDGRMLAVANVPGDVRLFESAPWSGLYVLPGHAPATAVAFHPDGRTILTGDGDGLVRFFHARTGELLRVLPEHEGRIRALDLSADGSLLASLTFEGVARVRHLPSDTLILELEGLHAVTVGALDLSPDGATLAVVEPEARVRLVDVARGEVLARLEHPDASEALSAAFDPWSGLLATAARERAVRLWTAAGEPAGEVPLGANPWTLEWHRDGRLAVSGWSRRVDLVDPAAGEIVAALAGHAGTVWAAAFHPSDPDLAATAGDDGTFRLWDLAAGRSLLAVDVTEHFGGRGPWTVAFGPDGLSLAMSGNGDPLVLDLAYYRHHLASSLGHHLERFRGELGGEVDEEALRAWADGVLAERWPRLSLERAR